MKNNSEDVSGKRKVCFLGMDHRSKQKLHLMLRQCKDDSIVLTDEAMADLIVMDLDHDNAMFNYRSLRTQQPDVQIVALSVRSDLVLAGVNVLKKPIRPTQLLEALRPNSPKMCEGLNTSSSAELLGRRAASMNKAPVTAWQANKHDEGYFDPGNYLLGILMQVVEEAKKRKRIGVIEFYGDRTILFDPKRKLIWTNLSSSQARSFSRMVLNEESHDALTSCLTLTRPSVEYLRASEAKTRYGGKIFKVPHERFMWRLGSMVSNGRLPNGTNVNDRVYLRRWPDMNGISNADRVMRIASYWSRQECSVREMSKALNIPLQEVCSVYVSAFAAGLAGKARRNADMIMAAPDVSRNDARGLFAFFMARLTGNKPGRTMGESFA